jgi:hypothetical protein
MAILCTVRIAVRIHGQQPEKQALGKRWLRAGYPLRRCWLAADGRRCETLRLCPNFVPLPL